MSLHVIVTEDKPAVIQNIEHWRWSEGPLPKVGDAVEILNDFFEKIGDGVVSAVHEAVSTYDVKPTGWKDGK